MPTFIIRGKNKLSGNWRVQGMKNAATPIIAATLLTREKCVIHNIPKITDLDHMLRILEDLGASVEWIGEHTISIQTKEIKKSVLDRVLAKRMRSSVLFIGPILAALGEVRIAEPGGCNIGNRPLIAHFEALKSLGAVVEKDGIYYNIFSKKLQACEITMTERSVTATENAMMLASSIKGETTIKNAASEPHVVCLGEFLKSMGAYVEWISSDSVLVRGAEKFIGSEFSIIPDQLEIGTIAVLGALTASELKIFPVIKKDVQIIKEKLIEAGVKIEEGEDYWIVRDSTQSLKSFKIKTSPFPGFPTDLQAPFGVLATQAKGESEINDPMYENRLGYIEELVRMGAKAKIIDAHTAKIIGPSDLSGCDIHSLDLRAGATLIIAGLIAFGETILLEAENIDRGYESIDKRLRDIGADITRVE
jgi:UDP-N-acetylglucosamine 1-carboxyvinyltransferase